MEKTGEGPKVGVVKPPQFLEWAVTDGVVKVKNNKAKAECNNGEGHGKSAEKHERGLGNDGDAGMMDDRELPDLIVDCTDQAEEYYRKSLDAKRPSKRQIGVTDDCGK